MRIFLYIFILLLLVQGIGFCSYLDQGNEHLNNNEPDQALPLLEKALGEDPTNPDVYINLGDTYMMLGNMDKALEIYKSGLPYAGELKDKFYYNMGSIHYEKTSYSMAVDMYTKSIEFNPQFPKPYLNRGYARLRLTFKIDNIEEKIQVYEIIIKDCETYLALYPTTPKRQAVEDLIKALGRKIKDKEQREKDLENLLDILNSSTDSTKDITAGAEDIDVNYEDEDILD